MAQPSFCDEMTGIEFETWLKGLFEHFGYTVKTTPATGDYGVDLLMEKDGKTVSVQAKRYTGQVGVQAIQEVFSGKSYYETDDAWLVTSSSCTKNALVAAEKLGVKIVDSDALRLLSSASNLLDNSQGRITPTHVDALSAQRGTNSVFSTMDFPGFSDLDFMNENEKLYFLLRLHGSDKTTLLFPPSDILSISVVSDGYGPPKVALINGLGKTLLNDCEVNEDVKNKVSQAIKTARLLVGYDTVAENCFPLFGRPEETHPLRMQADPFPGLTNQFNMRTRLATIFGVSKETSYDIYWLPFDSFAQRYGILYDADSAYETALAYLFCFNSMFQDDEFTSRAKKSYPESLLKDLCEDSASKQKSQKESSGKKERKRIFPFFRKTT